jgi:hypothetical protein
MSVTGIAGIAKRDIRKNEIITVVINMGELWSEAIDFQSPERKATLESRVALLEMRMDGFTCPCERNGVFHKVEEMYRKLTGSKEPSYVNPFQRQALAHKYAVKFHNQRFPSHDCDGENCSFIVELRDTLKLLIQEVFVETQR